MSVQKVARFRKSRKIVAREKVMKRTKCRSESCKLLHRSPDVSIARTDYMRYYIAGVAAYGATYTNSIPLGAGSEASATGAYRAHSIPSITTWFG